MSTFPTAPWIRRKEVMEHRIRLATLARLLWRTWPYLVSQAKHLIVWLTMSLGMQFTFVVVFLVALDLLNNKIFVGEKLEPLQASILQLDSTYVRTALEAAEAVSGQPPRAAATESGFGEDAEAVAKPTPEERLTPAQRKTVRNRLLFASAVVAAIIFAAGPCLGYYRTWILQRINQLLRVTMVERAEHLSLRYHSHARTGDAIYRMYQDSAMITSVVELAVLRPLMAALQILFAFLVICMFSLALGAVYLAAILPVIWFVGWYTPRLQWRSWRARTSNSDLTSRIQEAFAAIRVVKANRAEKIMGARFNHDSNRALDAAFWLRVEITFVRVGTVMMVGLAIIVSDYLMAGWTVVAEPTFLGGAVALVGFAAWNLGAFSASQSRGEEILGQGQQLVGMWALVQDMSVGLGRAFFLLDLKPDVTDADDAVGMPAPIREVRYAGVTFGYDPEIPVLKDVNLDARAGTITAIVGNTGSGKSTLTSLLLRLYDPDAGNVSINGTSLQQIRIDDLRSSVAIALQQNVLFAASVADNIAYASPNPSRESIKVASRIACADEFIRAMPDGYDTELGERGGKLSAGQRQRLSIARAVVRDTPILILDEPTASLDAETEHRVLLNLSKWGRERVVFLITHRLSTIRNADQIAFLEDGAIREVGDHEQLMSMARGHYRRFVEAETTGADVKEASA